MRFLIDASLPRSTAELIRQRGHDALDVRDLGPSLAADRQIADYARAHDLVLISGDFDFADIRAYSPQNYEGIVVIDRPEHATVATTLEIVQRVLDTPDLLAALSGRLVIADAYRIRVRPALA